MNEQGTLDLTVTAAAPEVSPEEVAEFLAYLDGRDWTKASVIQAEKKWNDRKVRALSRAARPKVVSYPGSKGYKLWSRCTIPEHDQCLRAFAAQRDDMSESYLQFWRAYHCHYRSVAAKA